MYTFTQKSIGEKFKKILHTFDVFDIVLQPRGYRLFQWQIFTTKKLLYIFAVYNIVIHTSRSIIFPGTKNHDYENIAHHEGVFIAMFHITTSHEKNLFLTLDMRSISIFTSIVPSLLKAIPHWNANVVRS